MEYRPNPMETQNVALPRSLDHLQERLAKNAHEIWASQRMQEGWTYGPKRDDRTRQNPCLVPYEELPESEKEYDRQNAMETLRMIRLLHYDIQRQHCEYPVTFLSTSTQTKTPQELFGEKSLTFPLVISFVGHRDLREEDIPSLKKKTQEMLEFLVSDWRDLHGNHPDTPPIYLLCGMAVGADQLVAKTIYEMNNPSLRVISVIPMARNVYEKEFKSEEEHAQLCRLLDQSECIIEIPWVSQIVENDMQSDVPEIQHAARDQQYESQTFYLATHGSLMIAMLCNEGELNGASFPGGTEGAVTVKLNIRSTEVQCGADQLNFNGIGQVLQLVTPRKKNSDLAEPFTWRFRTQTNPNGQCFEPKNNAFSASQDISQILGQISEINKGILRNRNDATIQKDAKSSEESSFPGTFSSDSGTQFLLKRFSICDVLANFYQRKNQLWLNIYVIVLTLIGVLSVLSTYGHFLQHFPYVKYGFNWGYTIGSISLIALYIFRRKFWIKYHMFHHAYRFIAEGIRIQIFWRVGGINSSIADYYRNYQIDALNGLRAMLQTLMIPVSIPLKNTVTQNDIQIITSNWVESQHNWYQRKIGGFKQSIRRWEILKLDSIILIVAIWSAVKIWNLWFKDYFSDSIIILSILLVLPGLISVIAVAMISYCKLQNYRQLLHRYQRMTPLFQRAYRSLSIPHNDPLLQKQILLELGLAAGEETAEWYLH